MVNFLWITLSLLNLVLFVVCLVIPAKNFTSLMIRLYCILMFSTDVIALILASQSMNNLFLFHIIIWLEIPILILFFCKMTPGLEKKAYLLIAILYVIIGIVFYFFESFMKLGTYSRFIESIFLSILAILYYNAELKNPTSEIIITKPDFWFVSGFLIYYGGTLLVSLTTMHIFDNEIKDFLKVWAIHNTLDIIKCLLTLYGLLCYRKQLISPP